MPELAGISAKKAIKRFERIGYVVVRQRGSHVRLKHLLDPRRKPLTIPMHRELKIGLLVQATKDARLTTEEFLSL